MKSRKSRRAVSRPRVCDGKGRIFGGVFRPKLGVRQTRASSSRPLLFSLKAIPSRLQTGDEGKSLLYSNRAEQIDSERRASKLEYKCLQQLLLNASCDCKQQLKGRLKDMGAYYGSFAK